MKRDRIFVSNKRLVDALGNRNPEMYMRACESLGIEPEDEYLVERREADRMFLEANNNLGYDVENVAKVTLRRFPELESGESISVREIKRRLSEIRKAGFNVKPYSAMNKREAWEYFAEIRSIVARDAREYCPSVLERIGSENERRKRDGMDFR